MASTPPPTSLRARTPPTPLHGPRYDSYEPYSPRRSKRATAQNNPYGTFNSERSPRTYLQRATTPPPSTVKKTRFARAPAHLSSPPESPRSPVRHKTPRKTPKRAAFTGAHSDSDSNHNLSSAFDPAAMLPTPSKTPSKKRQAAAIHSTARVLSFQPGDPNDVMPSPRKMKKPSRHEAFALFEDGLDGTQDNIEIFRDLTARVPELDNGEDNPFVGRRKPAVRPQGSRMRKRSQLEQEKEREMNDAVRNEKGMVYVFRGRKIFRRFEDDGEVLSDDSDLAQSSLKRKAGAAAQRPLTRSAVKPRLLFPSDEQLQERNHTDNEEDEEAVTDIEAHVAPSTRRIRTTAQVTATPVKASFKETRQTATPPSTKRTTRVRAQPVASMTIFEEDDEDDIAQTTPAPASPVAVQKGKGKTRSPFDDWPRTKSARGRSPRKREAEPMEEASFANGKRTKTSAAPTL